ncbi:MAG: hypothetical protein LEGION0403_FIIPPAGN_00297 [Legionella sp.]|uniref:hypothetical protein n=1 Tax=Legionella sp. TaxID=459 RepID=UPI003D0BADCC
MPGFFKRPDPEKNFFSNYIDHLHALILHGGALWEEAKGLRTSVEQQNFIEKVFGDRNLILQPLRDGHDYMDEIMGATVLPTVALMTAAGALVTAVWEGAQALAIHWGLARNDHTDHARNALLFVLGAAAALTISVLSFIKSWISLVSRPIATIEQGFAKQDAPRFYNEDKDPVVEAARDGVKGLVDSAANALTSFI